MVYVLHSTRIALPRGFALYNMRRCACLTVCIPYHPILEISYYTNHGASLFNHGGSFNYQPVSPSQARLMIMLQNTQMFRCFVLVVLWVQYKTTPIFLSTLQTLTNQDYENPKLKPSHNTPPTDTESRQHRTETNTQTTYRL